METKDHSLQLNDSARSNSSDLGIACPKEDEAMPNEGCLVPKNTPLTQEELRCFRDFLAAGIANQIVQQVAVKIKENANNTEPDKGKGGCL